MRILRELRSRSAEENGRPSVTFGGTIAASPQGGTEHQPLLVDQSSYYTLAGSSPTASVNGNPGAGPLLRAGGPTPSERELAQQKSKTAWESLNCLDKMAIFNLWNVVSTLGNLAALGYSVRSVTVAVDVSIEFTLRIAIGIACLMLWLSLVQYLEFNPRYYVMVLTLKRAVPRIGAFLVGILPCFFGYSLLGLIVFGDQNDLFGSVTATTSTLFAVVNGDSVLQV